MAFYIKVISGKITNGLFTGNGEIYDNANKYVRKGNFIKSKLNDVNGIVIDYDHEDYKLFQMSGNFVNDTANGTIRRIEYNGNNSLDDILANNLTVIANAREGSYVNGILTSVGSDQVIEINVTCAKHPTRGYFTNLVINEV